MLSQAEWERFHDECIQMMNDIPYKQDATPFDIRATNHAIHVLREKIRPVWADAKASLSAYQRLLKKVEQQFQLKVREAYKDQKMTETHIAAHVADLVNSFEVDGEKLVDLIQRAETILIFCQGYLDDLADLKEQVAVDLGSLKIEADLESFFGQAPSNVSVPPVRSLPE